MGRNSERSAAMGRSSLKDVERTLRARLDPQAVNATSSVTPSQLVTMGKKAGMNLNDQDAFAILNYYSPCTIVNRSTIDRPSYQPTFSWNTFQKAFWGPSQAEAMVQNWVPPAYTPAGNRSLSQAHDALKATLARHAKQGSNGLRKLLRLLLGCNSEHYGIGLSAPVFRREMASLGGDLTEEEADLLFGHNADPLTKMLNFDRFAAAFMPPGWAESQYALADAKKSMREEFEAKFAKAERPKREHPKEKAQPWKILENELRQKIVLRTKCKPKRIGLSLCYRLFSEQQNDPITLQAFEKCLTKLQLTFTKEGARQLFERYDTDRDGVISFIEFQRNLMPKDTTESESPIQNNTLFGDHSLRYEQPRKPRGANLERRIAMQQQGVTLPEVRQDIATITHHSLPTRKSPFSLIAPENPFPLDGSFSSQAVTYKAHTLDQGPLGSSDDIGRKDLQGRDPRRRKMTMPAPPTPHVFKSFHM